MVGGMDNVIIIQAFGDWKANAGSLPGYLRI